ncbi:MAG TPA: hypothetical protein VL945_02030 [Candidatus Saccharimonadales bacterium]|nr:hypothetical protein [Candidatus Saccharimonadales bacterium]
MATRSGEKGRDNRLVHYGRLLLAILAILIAAAHLSSIGGSSGGGGTTHAAPPLGAQALGLWIQIEIIAYAVIAVVFLLGIRKWYPAAVVFNAFNVILYFLSSYVAIPGITAHAFGSRFGSFGTSLGSTVLIVSWVALLILSIIFLKYDKGSKLEGEI